MAHEAMTIQTEPADEPVTLAEAKLHLRVTATDEDSLIREQLIGARKAFEDDTSRALINQTWDLTLDAFPSDTDAIVLPRSPLSSVTSIIYTDSTGTTGQTMDSGDYVVDTAGIPGRVSLASSKSWPATHDELGVIVIRFVAGYGTDAVSVPQGCKQAIKLGLQLLFERGDTGPGAVHEHIVSAHDRLVRQYDSRRYA